MGTACADKAFAIELMLRQVNYLITWSRRTNETKPFLTNRERLSPVRDSELCRLLAARDGARLHLHLDEVHWSSGARTDEETIKLSADARNTSAPAGTDAGAFCRSALFNVQ